MHHVELQVMEESTVDGRDRIVGLSGAAGCMQLALAAVRAGSLQFLNLVSQSHALGLACSLAYQKVGKESS